MAVIEGGLVLQAFEDATVEVGQIDEESELTVGQLGAICARGWTRMAAWGETTGAA